jgi:hypothetical protein
MPFPLPEMVSINSLACCFVIGWSNSYDLVEIHEHANRVSSSADLTTLLEAGQRDAGTRDPEILHEGADGLLPNKARDWQDYFQ